MKCICDMCSTLLSFFTIKVRRHREFLIVFFILFQFLFFNSQLIVFLTQPTICHAQSENGGGSDAASDHAVKEYGEKQRDEHQKKADEAKAKEDKETQGVEQAKADEYQRMLNEDMQKLTKEFSEKVADQSKTSTPATPGESNSFAKDTALPSGKPESPQVASGTQGEQPAGAGQGGQQVQQSPATGQSPQVAQKTQPSSPAQNAGGGGGTQAPATQTSSAQGGAGKTGGTGTTSTAGGSNSSSTGTNANANAGAGKGTGTGTGTSSTGQGTGTGNAGPGSSTANAGQGTGTGTGTGNSGPSSGTGTGSGSTGPGSNTTTASGGNHSNIGGGGRSAGDSTFSSSTGDRGLFSNSSSSYSSASSYSGGSGASYSIGGGTTLASSSQATTYSSASPSAYNPESTAFQSLFTPATKAAPAKPATTVVTTTSATKLPQSSVKLPTDPEVSNSSVSFAATASGSSGGSMSIFSNDDAPVVIPAYNYARKKTASSSRQQSSSSDRVSTKDSSSTSSSSSSSPSLSSGISGVTQTGSSGGHVGYAVQPFTPQVMPADEPVAVSAGVAAEGKSEEKASLVSKVKGMLRFGDSEANFKAGKVGEKEMAPSQTLEWEVEGGQDVVIRSEENVAFQVVFVNGERAPVRIKAKNPVDVHEGNKITVGTREMSLSAMNYRGKKKVKIYSPGKNEIVIANMGKSALTIAVMRAAGEDPVDNIKVAVVESEEEERSVYLDVSRANPLPMRTGNAIGIAGALAALSILLFTILYHNKKLLEMAAVKFADGAQSLRRTGYKLYSKAFLPQPKRIL